MRNATAEDQDRARDELSNLIREFDQMRARLLKDVDHLNRLAAKIDRLATDHGDTHVAIVARGQNRHLAALGTGIGRMRSLQTAERTSAVRREEDQREADYREAAREALEARRRARQEIVVPDISEVTDE